MCATEVTRCTWLNVAPSILVTLDGFLSQYEDPLQVVVLYLNICHINISQQGDSFHSV